MLIQSGMSHQLVCSRANALTFASWLALKKGVMKFFIEIRIHLMEHKL